MYFQVCAEKHLILAEESVIVLSVTFAYFSLLNIFKIEYFVLNKGLSGEGKGREERGKLNKNMLWFTN